MNKRNNNPSQAHSRSAFTLIELLVVISAILVLASLTVGVMASSQEDARLAATRSRVQVIEKLLETELEDYEVRRSPIPFRNVSFLVDRLVMRGQWVNDPANLRLHVRNLRRMITLDLIRAEMPDFRDPTTPLGQFPTPRFVSYLQNDLGLTTAEIATAFQSSATANVFRWTGWGNGRDNTDPSINSAEILYQILSELESGGSNGIDLLGNAAVGDNDGDGLQEVVDAWGDPLRFEFQQRIVVPEEQNFATATATPAANRSGVWETLDPMMFPAPTPQITDFNAILPNLPSEVRFFISSDKLLENDGDLPDFMLSRSLRPLLYQFDP